MKARPRRDQAPLGPFPQQSSPPVHLLSEVDYEQPSKFLSAFIKKIDNGIERLLEPVDTTTALTYI
jgi:hypothetical protein